MKVIETEDIGWVGLEIASVIKAIKTLSPLKT